MGCPGGCNEKSTYGRSAPYSFNGNVQKLSHGDCSGVTIDLLNMFLRLIKCVQNKSLYVQVKVSQPEIESGIVMLNQWIAAKEIDPESCDHQEKLSLVQVIVQRIVQYGQC